MSAQVSAAATTGSSRRPGCPGPFRPHPIRLLPGPPPGRRADGGPGIACADRRRKTRSGRFSSCRCAGTNPLLVSATRMLVSVARAGMTAAAPAGHRESVVSVSIARLTDMALSRAIVLLPKRKATGEPWPNGCMEEASECDAYLLLGYPLKRMPPLQILATSNAGHFSIILAS